MLNILVSRCVIDVTSTCHKCNAIPVIELYGWPVSEAECLRMPKQGIYIFKKLFGSLKIMMSPRV